MNPYVHRPIPLSAQVSNTDFEVRELCKRLHRECATREDYEELCGIIREVLLCMTAIKDLTK